jgi:hypothetical protein
MIGGMGQQLGNTAMLDIDTPLLFTELPTKYGPSAFLGRALIAMEEALRHRGIWLTLETMEALLDINKREAEDWRPLVSIFDATFNDLDVGNSFCLIGRDRAGQVVATQAARFFDWTDTNFKQAAETLCLFYKDPSRQKRTGETCTVSALAAQAITGRFVFSGAAWNAPRFRRSGVVQLLPRISRAFAYTKWNADVVGTMMARPLVERGVDRRVGYGNLEWAVNVRNSRMGDVEFSLQWIKAAEIVPDLKDVMRALNSDRSNGELQILHSADQR